MLLSVADLSSPRFASGDLSIDFALRRVERGGQEVVLTRTEYDVLRELACHSPKVLTYQTVLRNVWGPEYGHERQYLYVFVANLRRKIEANPQQPAHVLSVRGVGYRLV